MILLNFGENLYKSIQINEHLVHFIVRPHGQIVPQVQVSHLASYLNLMEEKVFDLVIVGAGCMGMAAAYYALKKEKQSDPQWSVCLIEHQAIGSPTRYWSSSFSARQNRVQYNEEYLTRYVVASNKEWRDLEAQFGKIDNKSHTFLHKQGALWFGNKNVSTSQGNIKASNAVITQINFTVKRKEDRIESLYMEKIMEGSPYYMKAFKPINEKDSGESEWDAWSALYQPDGGSVDMQSSYNRFHQYVKENGATIQQKTKILGHTFDKGNKVHHFKVQSNDKKFQILGKKILLTVGVYTPFFLRSIMKEPYLTDHANEEYDLQEYVASYMKIDTAAENGKGFDIYKNLPNFINFLDENETKKTNDQASKEHTEYTDGKENPSTLKSNSGYGFRHHEWDNLNQNKSHFIKLGTMDYKDLTEEQLMKAEYKRITDLTDHRIQSALNYAKQRMNYLVHNDKENQHYPCPIIFYHGRETLLDYLNRTDESVVVQSGGWVGKYYPLLAKTAIQMLKRPQKMHQQRMDDHSVMGSFINRTRFPITSRVNQLLLKQPSLHPNNAYNKQKHFKTMIIGAGCAGLYAAYRLNKQKHDHTEKRQQIGNIGIFELSQRISGRLKSFKFQGTATPMELGGMRYIPTNHVLVNKIITDLGIPHLKFSMRGDPIQHAARVAFLRNDYYRMNEWQATQKAKNSLHTAYRMEGHVNGMDSFQIVAFSFYMILTAPQNIHLLDEVFLMKTDADIKEEKEHLAMLEEDVHSQSSYYRNWKNYVYVDEGNDKNYIVRLGLKQWNQLKPVLLYRFRYPLQQREIHKGQGKVDIGKTYPLYKFGFQNVIEAQLGHEAYQFITDQNGYYSITSNASYLDQVMTYMLDFGNVSYRTLASGYDQINYAMTNVLLDSEHGLATDKNEGIYLGHKLVDILPARKTSKAKYELVFHVPLTEKLKKTFQKTKLHHCKPSRQRNELGVVTPIQDNQNVGEVRFTTDRIILGTPKKSVMNLANEIPLLQKSIEQTYDENYTRLKETFYKTFHYQARNKCIKESQTTLPLSSIQQEKLANLRALQAKGFENGTTVLSPAQIEYLEKLSWRELIHSITPFTSEQQAFEDSKEPKFEKDKPIHPEDIFKLADSAKLMPAMKIVMNFDRSWWDPNIGLNAEYQKTYKNTNLVNSVEEMRGVSVTDLPARQTLYFSSGPDNLLLASYNDMSTTEFWSALHENFTEVWEPTKQHNKVIPVDKYPAFMDIHPAKKVLVHEIIKQLSLMHQVNVEEDWVKECIYQFWGRDPYGAGYHTFNPGYDIPSVMKTIRKPWKDQSIHIVGEAYSNEPGWVEGAFQTTELLLQEEFKLSELVQDYYAGY